MATIDPSLGRTLYTAALAVVGAVDNELIFAHELIAAIDMTPAAYAAQVWRYPDVNGNGGIGKTVAVPITESLVVIDTWPSHGGFYILIHSCHEFDSAALEREIKHSGLKIMDSSYNRVNLA
jgi:hypothetical protein